MALGLFAIFGQQKLWVVLFVVVIFVVAVVVAPSPSPVTTRQILCSTESFRRSIQWGSEASGQKLWNCGSSLLETAVVGLWSVTVVDLWLQSGLPQETQVEVPSKLTATPAILTQAAVTQQIIRLS